MKTARKGFEIIIVGTMFVVLPVLMIIYG